MSAHSFSVAFHAFGSVTLLVILFLMGRLYLENIALMREVVGTKQSKVGEFYSNTQKMLQTLSIDEILKLEKPTVEQIFTYFRWTNSSSCGFSVDLGYHLYTYPNNAIPDGNKAVCWDAGVVPAFNNCLVYSFGVRNEWSFEERMEENGCDVFAFDPSMNVSDHKRSERIHFYRLGLLGKNYDKHPRTSWKMRTLSSIYEMLQPIHGQRIIDYLKIDIEWSEWETLPQIFQSGLLTNVKQLSMDVHLSEEASVDTFVRQYQMLRTIEEKYGFYRFASRPNLWSENAQNQVYFTALGRHENIAFEMSWLNSHYLISNDRGTNKLLL